MSDLNPGSMRSAPADRVDMSVDAGLRAFMLGVYNKVALGLVLSAGLAWLTSSYAPVRDVLFGTFVSPRTGQLTVGLQLPGIILAFAPLVILMGSSFLLRTVTARTSGVIYWSVVALIGASLGVLGLQFTHTSIFSTFLITAIAFGSLSLYGYATKRDLAPVSSFLIMGLIGLIIAMVVNMFLQSSMMNFIVSAIGVLIFAGLTAADTQRLKLSYYQMGGDQEQMAVATNFGALNLYLDFVNLFRFLLMFLGARR